MSHRTITKQLYHCLSAGTRSGKF